MPTATLARPLKTIERGRRTRLPSSCCAPRSPSSPTTERSAASSSACRRGWTAPTICQTPRVKKMVALLSAQLTIPVVTQDERLSSHEAEERLALREKDWRKRKAKLDAAAAAVILQDYLDARTRQ